MGITPLLAGAQGEEICNRLGRGVGKHFHHDPPSNVAINA
jgi:hypothetical protein